MPTPSPLEITDPLVMELYNQIQHLTARNERMQGALEDIITADDTSTLQGAVALAKWGLENEA